VCTCIILLPALINGFPFVYSDTGTYIKSAFEGYIPFDRPYWYGAFIRATSGGGLSLWGVAIAQSALCAAYILRVSKLRGPPGKEKRTALITCAVLTAGTGQGWYAGQLIPDIFTGIGLLAIYLLLRGREGAWLRGFDVLVIIAACWMHLSNLVILPLAGLALIFFSRTVLSIPIGRALVLWGAVAAMAWGGLALANRMLDGEFHISRSGPAFLMGRMIDLGILKPYLEEHCPTEHYGICAYLDSLPSDGQHFLWWADSPMSKQGGWAATRDEYDRIVRGSLTEPRFIWWQVRGSIISTADLLTQWEIDDGLWSRWYRDPDSPPAAMMHMHMPHEMANYLGSLQNGGRGELDMHWPDIVYRVVLGLSVLAMAWSLWSDRRNAHGMEARIFIRYAATAIVVGAWTCATLSTAIPRYLGRDSWLLPLAMIIAIAGHPTFLSLRHRSGAK
jgi:hypothetical protein